MLSREATDHVMDWQPGSLTGIVTCSCGTFRKAAVDEADAERKHAVHFGYWKDRVPVTSEGGGGDGQGDVPSVRSAVSGKQPDHP